MTTELQRDTGADLWPALGAATLCEAFQISAAAHPDQVALRSIDDSFSLTWADYAEKVRVLAGGLHGLGVGDGDTVALLLTNRSEFHLIDTAAMHLGAAPFSVYHTNPPEQIVPLLQNSGARVIVTEPAFLPTVRATRELDPGLERVVIIDGVAEQDGELSLQDLESLGAGDAGFDFEACWRAVSPDHVATIVYTSGTTGQPKGVEHTHGGLIFGMQCVNRLAPVSPGGRVISFLPNAHIAERYVSHYASLTFGFAITGVPDPKQLAAALRSARPTRFFGVPRMFEKLAAGARGLIDADPSDRRRTALEAGLARTRAIQAGAESVPSLTDQDERELAALRELLGLDQLEWVAVAAAPSPYSVLEFFHAIGVNVCEMWGMSECIMSTANPPARPKLGSVGIAIPGVEVRLADDGEILVRGPNVTPRYRKEPEKTAEAIDADGWLHSGDIAVADEDGYLKIVDRKKELIINSAGKNMSPAHIECAIKEESPLIGQIVIIGDGRQYVTAIIVLDDEVLAAERDKQGLPESLADAVAHPWVTEQISAAVTRGNARLARVEQVKTFHVLAETWAPGGEQLTPTMKVRRRVINSMYADVIDAMYAGTAD